MAINVNNELITAYWNIGKIIVENEKANNIDNFSSRQIILELSKQLTDEIGKGFSRLNLFNMRKFYLEYPDVQTLSGQLTWSHICELLIIEDVQKRGFYEKETINSSWSVRELKRQIDSSLYERLLLSKGETTKAGKSCPAKPGCSKAICGKAIQRSQYQSLVDENKKKINSNKKLHRKRQQIVEHPFGTIKLAMGIFLRNHKTDYSVSKCRRWIYDASL